MTEHPIYQKAASFIRQFYSENHLSEADCEDRLLEIAKSIREHGTYEHTSDELLYGAKLAWRNSNRCIGRLFWNSLNVFDRRDAVTEEEVKEALLEHIEYATNGGKIRSTVTIFKPSQKTHDPVRIYNHQLIRYAGYKQEDGSITGDPHSVDMTEFCIALGWQGRGTPFDILPLVIQVGQNDPYLFDIPDRYIKEVQITHPDNQLFNELDLRWYAVPIISEMKLEIGGVEYPASPFNGWYMETEIAARNFADESRYNMLRPVAEAFNLNTQLHSTMWKDRAVLELCTAVMHSFKQAGASIVDHHSASQQFELFEQKEKAEGREVTGDWTWLIPPVSPASTHIFHQQYDNTWKSPNFFYQKSMLNNQVPEKLTCPFTGANS
ncbi:nitric oxide synthase oxygenase [Jeotgalibacillus malaysiensis]|uniref:Nitric oxide synthase oxygenase n=1 Tax=Jeotgalibacillus malaysiensis TaxID=1508404 RepID=A0A0B5APF7_9BACL|nr:nitric oxide synthase oxygenase [Jeotgalibacillus malaysiensis]AJD90537.1 nitric oxide synthase oxygenase [Jeotgalibacillus malaysiensis]